ncbi:MAG: hypothetical protein JSS83_22010 [Cyanobacteria bacterium SZAS LIN-3]|nr:hypothetical protein [Cyanobacteria bacterium SZAS LIN-3]MBS2008542.1 hypothetical protein [Cyanobacteria bacterium SZAS TMP-1]
MSVLSDFIDLKMQKQFGNPTAVVQAIVPADDVSKTILEHMRWRFQFISLTPLAVGPHGGRILMLFQYMGPAAPGK